MSDMTNEVEMETVRPNDLQGHCPRLLGEGRHTAQEGAEWATGILGMVIRNRNHVAMWDTADNLRKGADVMDRIAEQGDKEVRMRYWYGDPGGASIEFELLDRVLEGGSHWCGACACAIGWLAMEKDAPFKPNEFEIGLAQEWGRTGERAMNEYSDRVFPAMMGILWSVVFGVDAEDGARNVAGRMREAAFLLDWAVEHKCPRAPKQRSER